MVAKSFTEVEGLDCLDTSTLVANLVILKRIFTCWSFHQDLQGLFLIKGDTRVYQLWKSLYRLKQAPHNLFEKFTTSLKRVGFVQSQTDNSLFTSSKNQSFIVVLIYVDDIIIICNDFTRLQTWSLIFMTCFIYKTLDLRIFSWDRSQPHTTNYCSKPTQI